MKLIKFMSASEHDILECERRMNVQFPDLYRDFLQTFNGGIVHNKTVANYFFQEVNEEICVKKLYGVSLQDHNDLLNVNESLEDELPPHSFVIGTDNNGYFVLSLDKYESGVYYWDKDLKLSISTEEANAYLISESFNDFWNGLGEINSDEGEINMEKIDYLALGSIVRLKTNLAKILIISRGLIVKSPNGKNLFFDYSGVVYPDGLIGDQIAYFNHDDITQVIFEGYRDEEDAITVGNINHFLKTNPNIVRGSVDNWD